MVRISRSPSPFFGPGGTHRAGIFFGPGPGRGGPFVVFLVLLLLVAAVVLVVLFIRQERVRRHGQLVSAGEVAGSLDALRILDERFAKGEVDPEDYKVRRDLLRGTTP
jgi:putative membrane protein